MWWITSDVTIYDEEMPLTEKMSCSEMRSSLRRSKFAKLNAGHNTTIDDNERVLLGSLMEADISTCA